mmetsp:Transcript_4668/g.11310  ORF Transcript_4668/g.11310 Transcript_4668/m.11310 type:complete len:244 (-) Transcript_4668:1333-2064(-)
MALPQRLPTPMPTTTTMTMPMPWAVAVAVDGKTTTMTMGCSMTTRESKRQRNRTSLTKAATATATATIIAAITTTATAIAIAAAIDTLLRIADAVMDTEETDDAIGPANGVRIRNTTTDLPRHGDVFMPRRMDRRDTDMGMDTGMDMDTGTGMAHHPTSMAWETCGVSVMGFPEAFLRLPHPKRRPKSRNTWPCWPLSLMICPTKRSGRVGCRHCRRHRRRPYRERWTTTLSRLFATPSFRER